MEKVTFITEDMYDEDGNLVPGSGSVEYFCDVLPAGSSTSVETDAVVLSKKLDVYAPANISVNPGDRLIIRGEYWTVVELPFNWAYGRRKPAHPAHRPRTQILVERGEVDG